jgi:hypothetical protein
LLSLLINVQLNAQKDVNSIQLDGKTFHQIRLSNRIDSVSGYYCVVSDSAFFISDWDYQYDDPNCELLKESITEKDKPYFLFSLDQNKPYSSRVNLCNYEPSFDSFFSNVDMRNILYPPEPFQDSLFIIKHIAGVYDMPESINVRLFVVNKKLSIKGFITIKRNKMSYFFYD